MDADKFLHEAAFMEALVEFVVQHDLTHVSFAFVPQPNSGGGAQGRPGAAVGDNGIRLCIECRSNRDWPLDVFACCADKRAYREGPSLSGAAYISQDKQDTSGPHLCTCATSRTFCVGYDISAAFPFLSFGSQSARDGRDRAKRLSEQLRSFASHIQRHLAVCSATRMIPSSLRFSVDGSWEFEYQHEQLAAWLPISWARDEDGFLGASHHAIAPADMGSSLVHDPSRGRSEPVCKPPSTPPHSQLLSRLGVVALLNPRVPHRPLTGEVKSACPLLVKQLWECERDEPPQPPVLFIIHSVDGVLQAAADRSGAVCQTLPGSFEALANFTTQHLTAQLDLSVLGAWYKRRPKAEGVDEGNSRLKNGAKTRGADLRVLCCGAHSVANNGLCAKEDGRCVCTRVLGSSVDHLGCCFFLGHDVGQNPGVDAPFRCIGVIVDWPGELLLWCLADEDVARRSSLAVFLARRMEAAVTRLVSENRDVWHRSAVAALRNEKTEKMSGCKHGRSPPRVQVSSAHTSAVAHSIVESLTSIIWMSPNVSFVFESLQALASCCGDDASGPCANLRMGLSTIIPRVATMAPQSLFDALSLTQERLRTLVNNAVQRATMEVRIAG